MSNPDEARRAIAQIRFNGTDITKDIRPYLLSVAYTDNEEDESDDLQITIQDRDDVWLTSWLQEAIQAASSVTGSATKAKKDDAKHTTVRFGSKGSEVKTLQQYLMKLGEKLPKYKDDGYFGSETEAAVKSFQEKNSLAVTGVCDANTWAAILKKINAESAANKAIPKLVITAALIRQNWSGSGKDKALDCGRFELDGISCSGPPSVITIKAVALPFSSQIRQTKLSKAWENYSLSRIAKEMASRNGMDVMFLSDTDPYYSRTEQYRQPDIVFLSTLCKRAGLSLKATNNMLVIFDQGKYEKVSSSFTIKKGDGSYEKYKLNTGQADVQYASCCVSYVDPSTGKSISGTAYVEDYDAEAENNQVLNIHAQVKSVGEAKGLAAKMLRMHNKFAKSLSFTIPGNPDLVVGVTVFLKSFGMFDGKYIVKKAKHQIGRSGYTTQIDLRPVINDYVPPVEEKKTFSVGDIVQFKGGSHYISSDASRATRTNVSPGPAKITKTNPGSKHPWHLIHTDNQSIVYGWVDDGAFS